MGKMISNPRFFMLGFFPIFKARGHERSEVGVPRCAPVSSAPERHLPRTVKKMLRSQISETTDVCKEPRVPNLGIYIFYILLPLFVRYPFYFCFVTFVDCVVFLGFQELSFLCQTTASWKRWSIKSWKRWAVKRSSTRWQSASASMRLG